LIKQLWKKFPSSEEIINLEKFHSSLFMHIHGRHALIKPQNIKPMTFGQMVMLAGIASSWATVIALFTRESTKLESFSDPQTSSSVVF